MRLRLRVLGAAVLAAALGAPTDPDTQKAQRAMAAMLEMKKIDIETLERAAEQVPA